MESLSKYPQLVTPPQFISLFLLIIKNLINRVMINDTFDIHFLYIKKIVRSPSKLFLIDLYLLERARLISTCYSRGCLCEGPVFLWISPVAIFLVTVIDCCLIIFFCFCLFGLFSLDLVFVCWGFWFRSVGFGGNFAVLLYDFFSIFGDIEIQRFLANLWFLGSLIAKRLHRHLRCAYYEISLIWSFWSSIDLLLSGWKAFSRSCFLGLLSPWVVGRCQFMNFFAFRCFLEVQIGFTNLDLKLVEFWTGLIIDFQWNYMDYFSVSYALWSLLNVTPIALVYIYNLF